MIHSQPTFSFIAPRTDRPKRSGGEEYAASASKSAKRYDTFIQGAMFQADEDFDVAKAFPGIVQGQYPWLTPRPAFRTA